VRGDDWVCSSSADTRLSCRSHFRQDTPGWPAQIGFRKRQCLIETGPKRSTSERLVNRWLVLAAAQRAFFSELPAALRELRCQAQVGDNGAARKTGGLVASFEPTKQWSDAHQCLRAHAEKLTAHYQRRDSSACVRSTRQIRDLAPASICGGPPTPFAEDRWALHDCSRHGGRTGRDGS
jgi:hypothetical protein